ncbi:MAG: pyruvate:ferredoxin (flavodoxin) oxidoreductase [Ruminococcus sp.]|nr:pyruvate:ferredoxin (flavodoxin) oxidoreductase [Ruminococcus sp.]
MKREMRTMDGNQAAAHVAYAFTETAAIYPITPSSGMAEYMDQWSAEGRKNLFGQSVQVTEMQSEAGAAGAVHGALMAGALASTFTASQGLLLMLPNLYRMAGELLPGVFHVAARTIATHALSIFGDHSDVYACRQTGAAILASSSVQEVMDLAPVAHMAALEGRLPFLHFFDGFRTSHEMQKIGVWDDTDLRELLDKKALLAFRKRSLHPHHRKIMGSAQNPDIFFQNREASNPYYDRLPELVEGCMQRINEKLGTSYQLFEYDGAPDAEHVVIAMGSVCETISETIRSLKAAGGKYGLIKVHLYRPFSSSHFLKALPESARQITVLDRTKEPGSVGEPLYLDVAAVLKESTFRAVPVFSGRYGLSSKDTTPEQILAVLKNSSKRRFTVGITDDVTGLSLPVTERIDPLPEDITSCKFWGLGGDGTVSANKSSVKIIGDHTDMQVQAYFEYDSKKSRGLTISHLRFGKSPIRAPYLVQSADLAACHNPVYMHKYNIVQEIRDGGIFLLNCGWTEQELERQLPGQARRFLAEHHIRLYVIDAMRIGKETGLNNKISTILQAAFFKVSGLIPPEQAEGWMKTAAEKSYGKKGEKIVRMNYAAIERGLREVREITVPEHWLSAEDEPLDPDLWPDHPDTMRYVANLQKPITRQEGDQLPVSAFLPYADGAFPPGTTAHERRNTATEIPVWLPQNCIQCNRCSYVCPHAVIRPAVLTEEEKSSAPAGMHTLPLAGLSGYHFAVTISETDCTSCGSCAGVCPGKKGEQALVMTPIHHKEERQEYFDYGKALPQKPEVLEKLRADTVRGSQFRRPLLEFHGACAGCGETPYAKLATQLFGERMYIANATGCSSIWAHSSPSAAYAFSPDGKGPAWSNSLFEDGAEFGLGLLLGADAVRSRMRKIAEGLTGLPADAASAVQEWLKTYANGAENAAASKALVRVLECIPPECTAFPQVQELLRHREYLPKKSHWVFGGDGFAYDIGFGGLDHVLAGGADINILIFDTEVYSNTGGQASKATPRGAEAKFASGGKVRPKKKLGQMMMTYGDVYVAQVAMGADYNQTLKAFLEAEAYPGASLIIAYAPCISHGLKAGMGASQHEEKKAVDSGYWPLFRYNPMIKAEGKNPFQLDSKEPALEYGAFLSGETRFTDVHMEDEGRRRYGELVRLKALYEPE